jgi:hypothetical protein
VRGVLDAFGAHSSRHAVPFVTNLLHHQPDLAGVVADPVADLARRGTPGAADLLRRTLARVPLGADRRFALLEAALAGAALEGDREEIEAIVEVVSEVLVRAADGDLDSRWEKRLAHDQALREVLEPHQADLERVDVLRRLGRVDEAAAVVLNLFHRAASDALPNYDPADLLELLEEIGADAETLVGARRHLPEPPPPPRPGDPVLEVLGWHPVQVLFVGGNETQEAYRDLIDDALRQRYGNRVAVTWEFPGWSPNWKPVTDRVEAALPEAHALVIMQFVRTNLGRHLRRMCDDHQVPWIPCTGHGRGSIERSLHRAVRVAAERLREKKRMDSPS